MTTFIDNNDFAVMKAQMQVLKDFAASHEVISEKMIDATIKAHRDTLTVKRSASIIGALIIAAAAGVFLYSHFALGKGSLMFTVATTIWLAFCGFLGYRYYKLNIHENLMGDNLTETAGQIAKWKSLNNSNMLYGAIGLVIWSAFYMFESGSEIFSDMAQTIIVCFIYVFVLGQVITTWKKVNKASDEMLQMIADLKK